MDLTSAIPLVKSAFQKALLKPVYRFGTPTRGLTNRFSSGKLYNSIEVLVEPNVRGVNVLKVLAFGKPISMAYDGTMVEGRKKGSKYPPYKAIESWMKQRKISIKGVPFKQAVFMIQRGISKFGIQQKPQNFIDVAFDILFSDPRLGEVLQDATIDEFIKNLEGV